MALAVFIPTQTSSRYGLLGAMQHELGEAFSGEECLVNPVGQIRAGAAIFLFLNFPESLDQLFRWAHLGDDGRPKFRSAVVQYFVDHPLALHAGLMDRLAALPHYRLVLPCTDDTHWLRLRWPGLKHVRCWHGVSPAALCDPGTLEAGHRDGRDIDVLVAGSIHTEAELEPLRASLPESLRTPAEDLVRFMLEEPHASFGQAMELCMPSGVFATDHFGMLQAVWRYTTAALNRARRISIVRALQGLNVTVIGAEAWRAECEGTIRYAGDAAYDALPGWFARARTAVAWGPTQFVHAFSERVLLGLAGGCACVADDRVWVRREFGGSVSLFDAAHPRSARAAIEPLLRDRDAAIELATRGRALVEARHLWKHRLPVIGGAAVDAMSSL